MIISDSKKFIFIHIPRTGGISMQESLQPWKDAQNLDYSAATINAGPDFPHFTAWEIRGFVGPARFQEYFKFAFVRNPWDRMVSRYFHLRKFNDKPEKLNNRRGYLPPGNLSFAEWLRGGTPNAIHPLDLRPQTDWVRDGPQKLLTDWIARFETLEKDFEAIGQRLGISPVLPHYNRSRHDDYRRYYDEEARDKVARIFESDIETWGYQF
jgi:hypothetical protein